MTENNDENRAFKLPTSGQVLGEIIRTLNISSDILDSRTARRLFEGGDLTETRKFEIINDLAKILVKSGILPKIDITLLDLPGEDWKLISLAIALQAKMWDEISGQMRSSPLNGIDRKLAQLPYLRLVTIDFSIRLVGILRLAGFTRLDCTEFIWFKEKSFGLLLKRLQFESGLTRDEIALAVEVTDNTVDSWLDGKSYPTETNILRLAGTLSKGKSAIYEETLLTQLRRNYTFCKVGDLLADAVGRENAVDLANHLLTYTHKTLIGLEKYSHLAPRDAVVANVSLLVFGSQFISAQDLTTPLWRQETDPVWRADLLASTKNWPERLTMIFQYLQSYPELAKTVKQNFPVSDKEAQLIVDKTMEMVQGDLKISPAQGDREGFVYRVKGDAKFSARNRMIQARYAISKDDAATALLHLWRAVELQPLNAEYHFQLGTELGKIGRIDEGIQECNIAVHLNPEWDLPQIEIGVILVNNRKYDEGRNHLEKVARIAGTISVHLAVSLGYARMHCGEFQGALELFDRVLAEKPDHALALDCSAHCCFLLGETDRGIALAKQALKLGASDTYRDWRDGKYRKQAD